MKHFSLKSTGRRACFALVLGVCMATGLSAQEAYPTRPIKLIVPVAAGGLTDILARTIAAGLTTRLGQQVVVDNRGGAGGVIGMTAAAKSPGDGYTLIMAYQGAASVNPVLIKDLPYNVQTDFVPVAQVATFPLVLVANAQVPATDMKQFVALAHSKPGKLSYASAGNASTAHLTMELLKRRTDMHIVHIPYKGEAPAINDLLSGAVDASFISIPSVLPHLASGRLRALGITSTERLQLAPALPTLAESGVPGFRSLGWFAILAPAGTSKPIVDRLNKEVLAILDEPDTRQRLSAQALTPAGNTPEALRNWILEDTERWRKVVTEAGIKAD